MNPYTYMTGSADVRSRKGFYIGSSDIPIILGLTPTTPMDLWRQKTGREEGFTGNDLTYWGHELEGVILKRAILDAGGAKMASKFFMDYSRVMYRRKRRWKPKTAYEPFTEAIHPDQPWMLAHADCLYTGGSTAFRVKQGDTSAEVTINKAIDFVSGKPGRMATVLADGAVDNSVEKIIEAKSGGFFANVRREDMDGYDRADPTASGVPFKVFFQVQWQMACYGITLADIAALIDTNKFSVYQVDASSKIQAKLIELGSRFMYCLTNDVAPTPRTFGDIKKLFPEINDRRLTIMGDKAAIAWDIKERRKKAATKEKNAKKEKEDLTNALALMIGENLELADEMGNKICSQSMWHPFDMLSPKKIKESCPEAYELLNKAGMIVKGDRRRINA